MLTKKTALILSLGLSALLVAPVAFAEEGSLVNSDTGNGSTNKIEVETKSNIDVKIDNDAQIDNNVKVIANTGKNVVEDNSNSGKDGHSERDNNDEASVVLNTGDAKAEVNLTNEANKTKVEIGNKEKEKEEEKENENEEENNGVGGGVVPPVVESAPTAGGIGGGQAQVGGIGGGVLPESGSSSEIISLLIALLGSLGAVYKFRKPFALN